MQTVKQMSSTIEDSTDGCGMTKWVPMLHYHVSIATVRAWEHKSILCFRALKYSVLSYCYNDEL